MSDAAGLTAYRYQDESDMDTIPGDELPPTAHSPAAPADDGLTPPDDDDVSLYLGDNVVPVSLQLRVVNVHGDPIQSDTVVTPRPNSAPIRGIMSDSGANVGVCP